MTSSAEGRIDRSTLYIGGEWVRPKGEGRIDVIESATEEIIGSVPDANVVDVDAAVRAASAASHNWAQTPPSERAEMVSRLGHAMEARLEELATLEAREVGTPIAESRVGQVLQAVEFLAEMPKNVAAITWEEEVRNSVAIRQPVGVVGAITAWNFPLQIIAAKAGAAMVAGCPVVVKVSELAPLAAFAFAEAADSAGIPGGVFNLLTGYGATAGQALASHAGVAKLSFTGSVLTAQAIARAAASNLTDLTFELGGKSASIILHDADLPAAIAGSLSNAFQGSGQVCCATTRLIVPRDRIAEAEEIAAEQVQYAWPIGDPLDEATRIGPLVSASQRARVRDYISLGLSDGARLVVGGAEPPEGMSLGYFVRPTVFSDVSNDLKIAREEIFGPVVVLVAADDDAHAVRLANESPYGLGGSVWSADLERAHAAARLVRAGQVEINGAPWNPVAPFGGFKASGHGRENGRYGVEEFLTWQTITG